VRQASWIATGFVAGLAVAGGAFLLLRDDASRATELARIGELTAHVDRLESAVTKLSDLASRPRPAGAPVAGAAPSKAPAQPNEKAPNQARAIADANALVDVGLQSGRWTREQQEDLAAAITDLDVNEQSRVLARVSKAINDGQLKFDPRQ
jgi:hypothetical protein